MQETDVLELEKALKRIENFLPVDLTKVQANQVVHYLAHLLEVNRYMNLTAITDYDQMMELHLLDSLSVLPYLPLDRFSLIDVGTGAGLPGIPLKIARPDIDLTLLDATRKRLAFLDECLSLLGLDSKARTVHGRAEEMSRQQALREQFDIAIARAVASLNVLAELCLPFVKLNGYFVAMKGEPGSELREAERAIELLGGDIADLIEFKLPVSGASRSLILIQKITETPKKYPRNAANIKKKAL